MHALPVLLLAACAVLPVQLQLNIQAGRGHVGAPRPAWRSNRTGKPALGRGCCSSDCCLGCHGNSCCGNTCAAPATKCCDDAQGARLCIAPGACSNNNFNDKAACAAAHCSWTADSECVPGGGGRGGNGGGGGGDDFSWGWTLVAAYVHSWAPLCRGTSERG